MAIDRKDYNISIGKGTHLKRHKDKINAFLFRMQNGGKENPTRFYHSFTPHLERKRIYRFNA